MKKCARCEEAKPDTDFPIKKERNGKKRLSSWCKPCQSKAASESNKRIRAKNPEFIRARDREYHRKNRVRKNILSRERIREFKRKCVEYLGGKCKICGYNKCIAALDFHHRNPDEKEFEVSRAGVTFGSKVKRELDKCDLLCSNCHKELHYENDERLTEVA